MKKKDDATFTSKENAQYNENNEKDTHRRGFITGFGTLGIAGLSITALSSATPPNEASASTLSTENTIKNLTELRTVNPSFPGQIYYLIGHTIEGIGGGFWYYDSTDTTSDDDNITVVIANGARIKLVDTTNLTLDQCGCIPDYADNTIDNSSILNEIFNVDGIFGDKESQSFIIPDNSQYRFMSDDIRITRNNLTISGAGVGSNLQGREGAKIILGEAIPSGGKKSGTKVVDIRFNNIAIKPQGNHSGASISLDYADYIKFNNCNIGSFSNDNESSFETGVTCRWVQWVYFNETVIDVNGHCVEILLENMEPWNEDHFHFTNCRLYNSKTHAGGLPASIAIDRKTGNNYSIFEFSMKGCHLGKFGDSLQGSKENNTPGVQTSGLKLINGSGPTVRTFHSATISGCFFENIDFPLDFLREAQTRDDLRISIDGTSFLNGHTVFYGQNINAHRVTLNNVSVTQFNQYAQHVRCHFVMGNNIVNVGGIDVDSGINYVPFPQGVTRHRFASKASNASLQGYRFAFSGEEPVQANANQATVTHHLSSAPSIFSVTSLNSAWISPYAITDINDQTFTIKFSDAPTQQRSILWSAEVQEK